GARLCARARDGPHDACRAPWPGRAGAPPHTRSAPAAGGWVDVRPRARRAASRGARGSRLALALDAVRLRRAAALGRAAGAGDAADAALDRSRGRKRLWAADPPLGFGVI